MTRYSALALCALVTIGSSDAFGTVCLPKSRTTQAVPLYSMFRNNGQEQNRNDGGYYDYSNNEYIDNKNSLGSNVNGGYSITPSQFGGGRDDEPNVIQLTADQDDSTLSSNSIFPATTQYNGGTYRMSPDSYSIEPRPGMGNADFDNRRGGGPGTGRPQREHQRRQVNNNPITNIFGGSAGGGRQANGRQQQRQTNQRYQSQYASQRQQRQANNNQRYQSQYSSPNQRRQQQRQTQYYSARSLPPGQTSYVPGDQQQRPVTNIFGRKEAPKQPNNSIQRRSNNNQRTQYNQRLRQQRDQVPNRYFPLEKDNKDILRVESRNVNRVGISNNENLLTESSSGINSPNPIIQSEAERSRRIHGAQNGDDINKMRFTSSVYPPERRAGAGSTRQQRNGRSNTYNNGRNQGLTARQRRDNGNRQSVGLPPKRVGYMTANGSVNVPLNPNSRRNGNVAQTAGRLGPARSPPPQRPNRSNPVIVEPDMTTPLKPDDFSLGRGGGASRPANNNRYASYDDTSNTLYNGGYAGRTNNNGYQLNGAGRVNGNNNGNVYGYGGSSGYDYYMTQDELLAEEIRQAEMAKTRNQLGTVAVSSVLVGVPLAFLVNPEYFNTKLVQTFPQYKAQIDKMTPKQKLGDFDFTSLSKSFPNAKEVRAQIDKVSKDGMPAMSGATKGGGSTDKPAPPKVFENEDKLMNKLLSEAATTTKAPEAAKPKPTSEAPKPAAAAAPAAPKVEAPPASKTEAPPAPKPKAEAPPPPKADAPPAPKVEAQPAPKKLSPEDVLKELAAVEAPKQQASVPPPKPVEAPPPPKVVATPPPAVAAEAPKVADKPPPVVADTPKIVETPPPAAPKVEAPKQSTPPQKKLTPEDVLKELDEVGQLDISWEEGGGESSDYWGQQSPPQGRGGFSDDYGTSLF